MEKKPDSIAVVDFGGQYAHLIARRIRQLHVYSEIVQPEAKPDDFKHFKGIIFSGGPSSVYETGAPHVDKGIFSLGIPILGICYGHQLIGHMLGGEVRQGTIREFGFAMLKQKNKSPLFSGLPKHAKIWMSHGDSVCRLPSGFENIGSTDNCETAAIADEKRKIYGLQFHPEVTHTPQGMKILENFTYKICKCKKSWTIKNFIKMKVDEIKKQAKGRNVFMLASGGVDSTVSLILLKKALGPEKIYALHVDSGFMRKNESKGVAEALSNAGIKVNIIDASDKFFSALKEVYDPEEKRKIIGNLFIQIVNEHLASLSLNPEEWLLGQGTIYPDTIETAATKNAAKIKTHHNRVDSIKQMIEEGKVIEPIAELYKDEVRELGEILKIPKELVWRHPFPGPALAIRIICSENEIPESLPEVEARLKDIALSNGFSAMLLPVKSVGVQGDSRSYRHAAVLQGPLDWEKLEKCSTEITNSIVEINRVVYAVMPEISSLSLKKAYLTKERVSLLQEADAIVMEEIRKARLYDKIWQFPVVLIPVMANEVAAESIVLRPISSKEAMTAEFSKLDPAFVKSLANRLMEKVKVSAVFYDVTHKPPATIEWE